MEKVLKLWNFGLFGSSVLASLRSLALLTWRLDRDRLYQVLRRPILKRDYLVLDLERFGMYFSWVFFLMACYSSWRMLNFLNCECVDI